jgi:hypothetical protein
MKILLSVFALVLSAFGADRSIAQSTDGYHQLQVFPVVVDTASFTQRFEFTTPVSNSLLLHPTFHPAEGTAQAATGPVSCPARTLAARGAIAFPSLRDLCPGLVAGSAFGFLRVDATVEFGSVSYVMPLFAGYSRVSNPQGVGFSVESFAASTFTSAESVVSGARRLAATSSSPAYQTNCFIGNMALATPAGTPPPATVRFGMKLAAQEYWSQVGLRPGEMVRVLDVFAAVGAPPGDYDGVNVDFKYFDLYYQPGIIAFCTVQENKSFSADFRIAKQANGFAGFGSQDFLAARSLARASDALGRVFQLGPGQSANTHVVYFRHPDHAKCMLLTQTFGEPPQTAGIEMRLINSEGDVIAGGNNMIETGVVYLGDKPMHDGANNRYRLEVENSGVATDTRTYMVYCTSGSGNTFGYDLIEYNAAEDRF